MALKHAPRIVTDGLVLALDAANPKSYPGSGTTWKDLSGNGNDGTLTNGPTFSGDNAGSISYDNINDYTQLSYSDDFDTDTFTIELMLKLNEQLDSDKFRGFFSTVSGNNGYQLFWHSAQYFYLYVNTIVVRSSTGAFNSGEIIHLVATYDANNSNNTKMYVNQNVYSSQAAGSYVASPLGPRIIGRRADNASDYHLACDLYICRFYNRALSAEEVLQNYNATKSRFYDI